MKRTTMHVQYTVISETGLIIDTRQVCLAEHSELPQRLDRLRGDHPRSVRVLVDIAYPLPDTPTPTPTGPLTRAQREAKLRELRGIYADPALYASVPADRPVPHTLTPVVCQCDHPDHVNPYGNTGIYHGLGQAEATTPDPDGRPRCADCYREHRASSASVFAPPSASVPVDTPVTPTPQCPTQARVCYDQGCPVHGAFPPMVWADTTEPPTRTPLPTDDV
jgi:hypothetical protein